MPDRSQRLAILTSSLGGGGAQRSMVKLAGGIADRGYGIDLVLGHADGHYASEVHPSVRIVDLGARKMVLSIPSFARYLRHERPRAVLSSLNHVNIVGLWARRLSRVSTRMVVSERNTLSMAKHGSWWRQRLRPLRSAGGDGDEFACLGINPQVRGEGDGDATGPDDAPPDRPVVRGVFRGP